MIGDYGHPIVAWRAGVHGLGDAQEDLLSYGFNSLQIQQINQAHQSGALSDAGYQTILSGFLSPNDLADFLAADPGAPQTSNTSVLMPTSGSPTLVTQLAPGPSPRVAVPSSVSSFFTGSTLIAGIPNVVVLGGLALGLSLLMGGKRR